MTTLQQIILRWGGNMYIYAVTGIDMSHSLNIEYCFAIYSNEKKALAVAKELNDRNKAIQILKHSDDDKKKLDGLIREYEQLLSKQFQNKNSIGIYYMNDDSKIQWDVKQMNVIE